MVANAIEKSEDRELRATRVFDAPRELVWKMWTEREHVAQWWGPRGFRNTIEEMDVRPGGHWRFVMHGPDGQDYQNHSVYVEVVKPERIVFDHVSGPLFRATAVFEDLGGKTRITWRAVFETAELRNMVIEKFGAEEGLHQNLDRLGEYLKSSTGEEFVIERAFDAPRDLMWKLWTDPEHLSHWFGPRGVTVVHSQNDFRVGGIYHFAMRTPDGGVIWGKWVYREIAPQSRFVFVSSFSDENRGTTRHPMDPHWPLEILSTIEFIVRDGRTVVVVRWAPINPSEVEWKTFKGGHASMNEGWGGTFERLENFLKEMA